MNMWQHVIRLGVQLLMVTRCIGEPVRIGNYHPCGATHEASVTDDFYDGFVRTGNILDGYKDTPVIVWRGPQNNNGHATENLHMNSWTTSKS